MDAVEHSKATVVAAAAYPETLQTAQVYHS